MPTGVTVIGRRNTTRKKRWPERCWMVSHGQSQADEVFEAGPEHGVEEGHRERAGPAAIAEQGVGEHPQECDKDGQSERPGR